jgi:hypothetical protein
MAEGVSSPGRIDRWVKFPVCAVGVAAFQGWAMLMGAGMVGDSSNLVPGDHDSGVDYFKNVNQICGHFRGNAKLFGSVNAALQKSGSR